MLTVPFCSEVGVLVSIGSAEVGVVLSVSPPATPPLAPVFDTSDRALGYTHTGRKSELVM